MKKFLTLVLALVLALAMTVPAMAFTDTIRSDADEYEVDVYLVEYEDDEFFGLTGMPPSDRGYAKNEIVAAIAELHIPKNADDLDPDEYSKMVFDGDNVNFNLVDNKQNRRISSNLKGNGDWMAPTSGSFTFVFDEDEMLADNDTYKWLFFAKVTGDDASITATLKAYADDFEDDEDQLIIDEDYAVVVVSDGFEVYEWNGTALGDLLFTIFTNAKGKTTGLTIHLTVTVGDGTTDEDYEVVSLKNGLGFIGPDGLLDAKDDKAIIRDLMDIYNDVFVDVFGFDFDKLGNVVDTDTFLDLVGSDDIEATVEIRPWTAYVTVPDAIVIDPPKTGGAASIVGFVMISLAAAAVVAVRKVRA